MRTPDCLIPFVQSRFYHPAAANALGNDAYVSAAELVRYAWTSASEVDDKTRLWEDLRSCLLSGKPVSATSKSVQLSGAILCDIERGEAGWKLTAFSLGE
jgi:hypothetical protein